MAIVQSPFILIVEDNAGQQLATSMFITELGWQPVVASNGREALKTVQSQLVDLILMDLNMPEMDGFEAARRIRALPGAAGKLPIIAVSANNLASVKQQCLAAGMNDFVPKPVNRKMLLTAIEKVLPDRAVDVVAPFDAHSSPADQRKAEQVLKEIDALLSE